MDAASEAEWSALTYAHHRTAASAAAPGATFIGRMDNLARTLVGAALGRAVADRKVPGAALLGALAGNAPDWTELLVSPEAVAPRFGPPSPSPSPYLLYHRGITPSLIGPAAEIAALSALVGLALHWQARRTGARPAPWRWIVALIAATVASHLYLDWQGSYGLRPFLPWSSRWYYADWIAIVDPFFWIVPLVALAWGARRHWLPALGYVGALLGVTALVLWARRPLVAPRAAARCAGSRFTPGETPWRGATGPCRAASPTRPWCRPSPRRRGGASRSSRASSPRKSIPAEAACAYTCGTRATTPQAPWD